MIVPKIDRTSAPSASAHPPDGAPARTQRWPLRSRLELRPVPAAARSARLHARNTLRKWHMAALTETVELLVSEIVGNAINASARVPWQRREIQQGICPPRIRFWLASDRRSVLIQVWDGDPHQPVRQDPPSDAEAGRGLLLIEALSEQWGSYALDGQSGKIVWAVCARWGTRRKAPLTGESR